MDIFKDKNRQKFFHYKKILNQFTYKNIPLGQLDNRFIADLVLKKNYSIKIITKNLFFIRKPKFNIHKRTHITYLPSKNVNYLKQLELYLEKLKINYSTISNNDFKLKVKINFKKHNLIKSVIKELNKYEKLKLIKKIYIYSHLNYLIKFIDSLEKINYSKFKSFNAYLPYEPPISIINEYCLKNNIKRNFFQIANTYIPNKFKYYEMEWLGLNIDTLYVYGSYYKKIFQQLYPTISCEILKIKDSKIQKQKSKFNLSEIIILGNQKELKEYNLKMLLIVKSLNMNPKIKLHPSDNINNYNKILPTITQITENLENTHVIYIVNDSSIYFEFIKSGKVVFRYKNKDSFLNINKNQKFVFSNKKELNNIIKNFKYEDYMNESKNILKNIYS